MSLSAKFFFIIDEASGATISVIKRGKKFCSVSGVMGNQINTELDPVEERLRNKIDEEKKQYVFIFKNVLDPSKLCLKCVYVK